MNDEEAIARGIAASSELTQVKWAFDEIRKLVIEKWAATGMEAVDTREKFFSAVKTIDMVQKALMEVVTNGQVTAHAKDMAELLAPDPRDR